MFEELIGYLFLGMIGFYFYWVFSTANKSINVWIRKNDFKIITKQFRMFRTGPYILTGNRPVYKIVVQDSKGIEKTFWIRCNSLFGFNPEYFEVRPKK